MRSLAATDLPTLLREVAGASDVAEGCSRVLGVVLQEGRYERGFLALRRNGIVRGAGIGATDELLPAVLDGCAALADRDIEAGEGGAAPLEDADLLAALGDPETASAIPVPGARDDTLGCAILPSPPDQLADAAWLLETTGPILDRLLALEAREAEDRRLHRRYALLEHIVEMLPDPVVVTDAGNDFIFANPRAENLFSAAADESDGRRRAVQVNDLLFSSFLTQSIIGGESGGSRELNLVDPEDGSDLLFEVLSIPLPTGMEERELTISILRDITDLKQAVTELEVQFNRSRAAEQAARRESERLNAILANVEDPILVTDDESNLVLMNRMAETLFEPSAELPPDAPERRAVRANDAKFTSIISDFLLQPAQRMAEKLEIRDPDESRDVPMEIVSSKITDWRGEVSTIVSVLHDLTEVVENERLARELQVLNEGLEERIRLATEELEERNRRLEWQSRELQKASRLKSEFLASMSHELRTPINAMLGYTSLLRERIYGDLNDRQEQALSKIHTACDHLLALINDILDLSRIEAGKMPLKVEDLRLEAVIGELSQTIEPMIREKELEYETELYENLPQLRSDRTKVKQILLNLLSNAVKFTPSGSIHVRAMPLDDRERVRIEVRDTGIGISPEQLEEIFQDFRQVDQSPTRQFGGAGLGLSITRKLVHLLGGTISVESEEDEGSTFSVELPVDLRDSESAGEAAPGALAEALPDQGSGATGRTDAVTEGKDRSTG